jgi:hypothetical protein
VRNATQAQVKAMRKIFDLNDLIDPGKVAARFFIASLRKRRHAAWH